MKRTLRNPRPLAEVHNLAFETNYVRKNKAFPSTSQNAFRARVNKSSSKYIGIFQLSFLTALLYTLNKFYSY